MGGASRRWPRSSRAAPSHWRATRTCIGGESSGASPRLSGRSGKAPHGSLPKRPGGDRLALSCEPVRSGGELAGSLMARHLELAERTQPIPCPVTRTCQRAPARVPWAPSARVRRDADPGPRATCGLPRPHQRAAAGLGGARRVHWDPSIATTVPPKWASTGLEHSLDARLHRDFVLDFLAACVDLPMHLSRLAEDRPLVDRGVRLLRPWPRDSPRARASCPRRRTRTRPSSCGRGATDNVSASSPSRA